MKYKAISVFEQIKTGLEDGIAHSRDELNLKTTSLPLPPPKANAGQIAKLRKSLRMSQSVFAATLNVSAKTVQSWEQGARQPADAALRMLQVISEQPAVVQMILSPDHERRRTAASAFRRNSTTVKTAV